MDWHDRYKLQAAWTSELRKYLFEACSLGSATRVLEVGCGTGAVLEQLQTPAAMHGADIDPAALAACGRNAPAAIRVEADALSLPYLPAAFDIVYCHYLLLWVADPVRAIREMKRVARPGGHILALAEPDYNARTDEPASLRPLGRWQAEALGRQGADPGFGAHLAEAFHQAGLQIVETGTLRSPEKQQPSPAERDSEWHVLESDLAGTIAPEKMREMKELEEAAWKDGRRRLDVPTYFAWGRA